MRKVIYVLLVILMIPSCGDKVKQRQATIAAVVGKPSTPYWDGVRLGMKAAGRDLGVKTEFFAPDKEDPAWQIKKIEELIAKPVDGIAFAASDPKSITPSILKAMQAEIPCIALDTDIKSRHAYIGTGNYYAGQQAGEKMVELLNGRGKVAVIIDSPANDVLQRVQGFRDILAEHEGIKITATLQKDQALTLSDVDSFLGLHPELDGVFCASDASGVVAADAIRKVGKVEQVKVVCMGESDAVMKQVRDNVIQAAISRRPYKMGYLSVLVLYDMVKAGITNTLMILPKSEIVDIGVVVVTPLNIIEYREQLKRQGVKVEF